MPIQRLRLASTCVAIASSRRANAAGSRRPRRRTGWPSSTRSIQSGDGVSGLPVVEELAIEDPARAGFEREPVARTRRPADHELEAPVGVEVPLVGVRVRERADPGRDLQAQEVDVPAPPRRPIDAVVADRNRSRRSRRDSPSRSCSARSAQRIRRAIADRSPRARRRTRFAPASRGGGSRPRASPDRSADVRRWMRVVERPETFAEAAPRRAGEELLAPCRSPTRRRGGCSS